MLSLVGVEEVGYGGERQVVLVFNMVLNAFKQLMDSGQGGETNHKSFARGGISGKQIQLKHSANQYCLRSL